MPPRKLDRCPHCGQALVQWENPDGTTWGDGVQLVCFNDGCPYFKNGWSHMKEKYNQNLSYRFRHDPATGESGPLPVWSSQALRHLIKEQP